MIVEVVATDLKLSGTLIAKLAELSAEGSDPSDGEGGNSRDAVSARCPDQNC